MPLAGSAFELMSKRAHEQHDGQNSDGFSLTRRDSRDRVTALSESHVHHVSNTVANA